MLRQAWNSVWRHRVFLSVLCSVFGISAGVQASVYDGDRVPLTTAGNGAVVNAELAGHPFMRNDPKLVQVRDQVWTVTGYALSNCSFVVTREGVVVFDTGSNIGQGRYFFSQIRSVTDLPIIAIIYSHSHYANGTASFLEEGAEPPEIIGHPSLASPAPGDLHLYPSRWRRANLQFGAYLPMQGPDARVTTAEPEFADPALRAVGFLPVTRPVRDGEILEIGGLAFKFLWTPADTLDSLTVWIPELETALTNSVAIMYYPLYTLRGEKYRDPSKLIESYDRIRALSPDYYVPVHGSPLVGARQIANRLTLHRDAYAFTYHQAIRAINRGWTPDQMVERITLPERIRTEPTLYEVYSEFPYALRGIYRGLVGWFDEDTAKLNPPSPRELGEAIVAGFGGIDALLEASRDALADDRYNLAASLANFALQARPGDSSARQAKADALRMLGRVSKGLQSHNFYLTEALYLEGKIQSFRPPATPVFPAMSAEQLARLPTHLLIRLLESRVNPKRISGVFRTFVVTFTDTGEVYGLEIRDGVAEILSQVPKDEATQVRVSRLQWTKALQFTGPTANDQGECELEAKLCELLVYLRD